jgi:hypothetical protein
MFEQVKELFRAPLRPAEERAEECVGVALSNAFRDPDTEEIIATMAEAQGVAPYEIHKEIRARQDDLLEKLRPLLESWQRSELQLEGILESRKLYSPRTDPLRWLAIVTLGLMAAVIVIFFAIGLPTALFPWNWPAEPKDIQVETPGFGSWISGALIAVFLYQPLRLQLASNKRLEGYLSIPESKGAEEQAEGRFRFAAKNLAAVLVRETINERLASFSTEFELLDHRGLRALADPDREVSTAAGEQLLTLMASLSSGSIGLSGPRGVGKTTLIESFANGRSMPLDRKRIGLVVSAPVKYDAKEFVLHLFASLCERVINPRRLQYLQARDRVSLQDRRRARLLGVFGLLTLLVLAAAAAMLVFDKTLPEGPRETAYVLLAIGGLMAVGWRALGIRSEIDWDGLGFGWLPRLLGGARVAPPGSSERRALRLLEQIRFQQTVSSTLSGSARLPLGLAIGAESSVTTARVPWSLPEAVEEFRKYAASLTDTSYLVIGIDELDKMGSDVSAREFLNNVKGVFGVSGCYYLVSVSDDAMASFERRGMPVRDVFDSSFDAVQRVGYLTLGESRAVLDSRVVGLPIPYQCLCHCLAGGLPRDLIRVTRELVHQAQENELTSMDELARAVVGVELRAKTAAAIEKIREADEDGSGRVQMWLDNQGGVLADAKSLEQSIGLFDVWAGLDPPRGAHLAFEVATFDYYAATVLELFRDKSRLINLLQGADTGAAGLDPCRIEVLETLAKARQQFAISPDLAWRKIVEVRDAMELTLWDDPRTAGGIKF